MSDKPRHAATGMRKAVLDQAFVDDLAYWIETDRRVARRLVRLMKEICGDPLSGTGKPEPLRESLSVYWSRRLTETDRVVYRAYDDHVNFAQGRYHYERR